MPGLVPGIFTSHILIIIDLGVWCNSIPVVTVHERKQSRRNSCTDGRVRMKKIKQKAPHVLGRFLFFGIATP